MRRLGAALAICLTSTACSGPDADLPPAYRRLAVPEERLGSPDSIERGQALYASHCALCHGEGGDGRGQRSAGFARPPARLNDPSWRRQTTPRRVFFVVREGLRGTPMPGWSGLGEEETWDLVAYVLTLAEDSPAGGR